MNTFVQDFFILSHPVTYATLLLLGLSLFFIRYSKKFCNFQLRMILALILGFLYAMLLQWIANFPEGGLKAYQSNPNLLWLYESYVWIKFFSTIFINFLKLLVIPLIFIGIIHVILQLQENINIRSLLTTTLFWLLFTTAIAATLAVILGAWAGLGESFTTSNPTYEIRETKNITTVILNFVPNNIIGAANANNIIGVVIFAFFIALSARTLKLKAKQDKQQDFIIFERLISALHQIIMRISLLIIKFMPYAIFMMIANTFIEYGFDALQSATLFIGLLYTIALLMWLVHLSIIAFHGLNPLIYIKKSLEASIVAFTSRSSVATLPITINALSNMGVSKISASFSATLGTTVGANGCAGYFGGLLGIFTLNALGVEPTIGEYISLVILCVVASVGVAGIPGIATMVASIVLTGLGLGEHFGLIAIILAIDPILDMARTFSNVNGAMVSTIATDSKLKLLNKAKFNQT